MKHRKKSYMYEDHSGVILAVCMAFTAVAMLIFVLIKKGYLSF